MLRKIGLAILIVVLIASVLGMIGLAMMLL